MSQPKTETVGIVVVHGVGDHFEGWTDHYLVPELERWRAFQSVAQLDAKGPTDELTLILEAAHRYIAVSVDKDAHFHGFCDVAGLEVYKDDKRFKTRAARLANRDELIQYAAQVSELVAADRWLASLRAAGVPCGIAFYPESEVNRVRDPEAYHPTETWQSFSRAWPLKGRHVIVTELFWADLSKVGTTSLTRMAAILQLVMESPRVLGSAFIGGGTGVHTLIRWLILFANWLMQRPIAGLNTAIFTAAFALLLVESMLPRGTDPVFWLRVTLIGSFTATAIAGMVLFYKWAHRIIGLADVAISTWLFSVLLIVLTLSAPMVLPKTANIAASAPYLLLGLAVLLAVWLLWTIVIATVVVLVSLVALKRLVFARSKHSPPIARAGASITLSVLFGMLWKFVLALAGVLTIGLAVPDSLQLVKTCGLGDTQSFTDFIRSPPMGPDKLRDECLLAYSNILLIGIAIINFLSIVGILTALLGVVAWRRTKLAGARAAAARGEVRLPRLIAHWSIVFMAFVAAIINPILILGPPSFKSQALDSLHEVLFSIGSFFLTSVFGIFALLALYVVFNRLIDLSNSFVHIGRDLVNHQYNGVGGSLMTLIEPDKSAFVEIDGKRSLKPYRRRLRVQRRLEALIDEVIGRQDVDRLILVGHSQGSVILYDYLTNKDSLVRRDHLRTDALADVTSIDILTLGSPLTHIYKHYFHHYAENPPEPDPATLLGKAQRWVNMWRIDDPIGHDVDVFDRIENVRLPPGGHEDYWRENAVCEMIWDMIWAGQSPSQSPGQSPEAADRGDADEA